MRDLVAWGVKSADVRDLAALLRTARLRAPWPSWSLKTPAEFVAAMVEVFGLVRELLADDGFCSRLNLRSTSYNGYMEPAWNRT